MADEACNGGIGCGRLLYGNVGYVPVGCVKAVLVRYSLYRMVSWGGAGYGNADVVALWNVGDWRGGLLWVSDRYGFADKVSNGELWYCRLCYDSFWQMGYVTQGSDADRWVEVSYCTVGYGKTLSNREGFLCLG